MAAVARATASSSLVVPLVRCGAPERRIVPLEGQEAAEPLAALPASSGWMGDDARRSSGVHCGSSQLVAPCLFLAQGREQREDAGQECEGGRNALAYWAQGGGEILTTATDFKRRTKRPKGL